MNPLVIARWLPLAKQVYDLGELIYCRIKTRRARKRAAQAKDARRRVPPPPKHRP